MFICTYDIDSMENLKSINAKLVNTVKMKDKGMFVFLFNKDIYNMYCSKFNSKNVFISNKLSFA